MKIDRSNCERISVGFNYRFSCLMLVVEIVFFFYRLANFKYTKTIFFDLMYFDDSTNSKYIPSF